MLPIENTLGEVLFQRMLTYAAVCIAGEARFFSNGRVLEGSIR
jgi:hypothetical protein